VGPDRRRCVARAGRRAPVCAGRARDGSRRGTADLHQGRLTGRVTDPTAKRVLVTDSLQEIGVNTLRGAGPLVDVIPTLVPEELARRIGPYHALVIRSASRVTAAVIEAGSALEVIGRAGVGFDNVDVDAATQRGIVCMNTPGGNTIAAAEHTLALLLAVARKLPQAHAHLRGGKWDREP